MRAIAAAAIVLAVTAGAAHADTGAVADWYRQARAAVQSLIGAGQPKDDEVIAPPGNIDPDMVVVPPSSGRMRVIRPRDNRP